MILFFSSFLTVFLLVFQQQNVANRRYFLASTTSVAITVSQFALIKAVTVSDLSDVLLMAVGGVIGVVLSMFIHPKVLNYYKKTVKSA
jgi:glycopeptide antibiotics resistance protein